MKGFIEVTDSITKTKKLLNIQFIQSVIGNTIVIWGRDEYFEVYPIETYEEIKSLIEKATKG